MGKFFWWYSLKLPLLIAVLFLLILQENTYAYTIIVFFCGYYFQIGYGMHCETQDQKPLSLALCDHRNKYMEGKFHRKKKYNITDRNSARMH
jgi:hypothetical protein